MATTYRSFVDALEALTITGTNREYTQGPPIGAPGVADCPFQYVRYPGSDEEHAIVFGEQGGRYELHAELVIGIEPVGQNTAFENFDNTVDMMDNVQTALQAASCITDAKLTWTLSQIIDTVAGDRYWAVLARVSGWSIG
jgi:hypothetical protein